MHNFGPYQGFDWSKRYTYHCYLELGFQSIPGQFFKVGKTFEAPNGGNDNWDDY